VSSKSQDSQTATNAHYSTRTHQDHSDQLICVLIALGLFFDYLQWWVPLSPLPSRHLSLSPFHPATASPIPPSQMEEPLWLTQSKSSPGASSPASPGVGAASGRPSSPTPPGGPKTAIRRRAAADQKEKAANVRPASTRAAGAGGSSSTMLSMSLCLISREGWSWQFKIGDGSYRGPSRGE
jgi:hypothetical protein